MPTGELLDHTGQPIARREKWWQRISQRSKAIVVAVAGGAAFVATVMSNIERIYLPIAGRVSSNGKTRPDTSDAAGPRGDSTSESSRSAVASEDRNSVEPVASPRKLLGFNGGLHPAGVRVFAVQPGTPATRMKRVDDPEGADGLFALEYGDVVTHIDDVPVKSPQQLNAVMDMTGDVVRIRVLEKGSAVPVTYIVDMKTAPTTPD